MPLFSFYDAFGRELSDTKVNNMWYASYCKRKNLGNAVVVAHQHARELDVGFLQTALSFPMRSPWTEGRYGIAAGSYTKSGWINHF